MLKYWTILVVVAVLFPLLAAIADDRTFGPEWKKVTFPNADVVEYQRSVQVVVTHPPVDGASHYTVPLENGTLVILEEDGNRGLEVRASTKQGPRGGIGIETDERGKPSSYWVNLGGMDYYDFNGDGILDARYDVVSQKPFIMFEGREIPVENTKVVFSKSNRARSLDLSTTYVFTGGKWNMEN